MLITVMINVIKTVPALAEINIKKDNFSSSFSIFFFLFSFSNPKWLREAELLSEVLMVKIFELFRKHTTTVTTRTTTTTTATTIIILISVFIKC